MLEKRYQNAMDHLPLRPELEKETLEKLMAASVEQKQEASDMKKSNKRRVLASVAALAAAACLALVLIPTLNPTPEALPAPRTSASMSYAAVMAMKNASSQSSTESLSDGASANAYVVTGDTLEAETSMVWDHSTSVSMAWNAPAPMWNTEEYSYYHENGFFSAAANPLSTFAADVDTASYAKLRDCILNSPQRPVPKDSVRIEEMLNYFHYDYAEPTGDEPFGVTTEIVPCPWNENTELLLVGLQAQKVDMSEAGKQNLVFLVDVSGSMDTPDKLDLLKRSFLLLTEQLTENDTVSLVTYASSDRLVLDGVSGAEKETIRSAIQNLTAGGGTAGAAGIQTAYELAKKHFIKGGNNRVLLATDGDLNIGVSSEGELTRLIEEKRKSGVFLSVLGFGTGNYKDNKLSALAENGNGNYHYIDTIHEARKVLVEEMGGTFLTVAKDVKLQLDFNPAVVKGYRLLGYESRLMAAEDFANDAKDGGELGSGHRVTVLYEVAKVGSAQDVGEAQSKYVSAPEGSGAEWLTVNVRAKAPDGDESQLYSYPVGEESVRAEMRRNMAFAAAVAEVAMVLKESEFKGSATYDSALSLLRDQAGVLGDASKEEFLYMVRLLARDGIN